MNAKNLWIKRAERKVGYFWDCLAGVHWHFGAEFLAKLFILEAVPNLCFTIFELAFRPLFIKCAFWSICLLCDVIVLYWICVMLFRSSAGTRCLLCLYWENVSLHLQSHWRVCNHFSSSSSNEYFYTKNLCCCLFIKYSNLTYMWFSTAVLLCFSSFLVHSCLSFLQVLFSLIGLTSAGSLFFVLFNFWVTVLLDD